MIRGNVGQVVEWYEDERFGGRAVFNVGVTPSVQRDGTWHNLVTTWYRVTCWRRLATHVRDSLRKGDAVVVGGKLSHNSWVGENNVVKEEFQIEARWVGHDLTRGTAVFERTRLRQDRTEPSESDFEAARAEYEDLRALEEAGFGDANGFGVIDLATGEVKV